MLDVEGVEEEPEGRDLLPERVGDEPEVLERRGLDVPVADLAGDAEGVLVQRPGVLGDTEVVEGDAEVAEGRRLAGEVAEVVLDPERLAVELRGRPVVAELLVDETEVVETAGLRQRDRR